jgi:two-component system sensor histidine kinase YesM
MTQDTVMYQFRRAKGRLLCFEKINSEGDLVRTKRVLKWFLNLRISAKITLYYFVILVVSLLFISLFYKGFNDRIIANKVTQISLETTNSINSNLDYLINDTDNQSKILISDDLLQNTLKNGTPIPDYSSQYQLNSYLSEFINFNPAISSVYVFDNYGNECYTESLLPTKRISLGAIKSTSWYQNLTGMQGGYLLMLNSGGLFAKSDENYISMIRVINDINTQKTIGIMVINISENYIDQVLEGVNTSNSTKILLRDVHNQDVIHSDLPGGKSFSSALNNILAKSNTSIIDRIDSEEYIITNIKDQFNFKVITVSSFGELSKQDQVNGIILLIAIIVNGILLIVGLIITSLLISRPLQKLVKSMKAVESGEFKEVDIKTGNDEIGKLKDVYNIMIREIQKLFSNIIEEQKIKRKAELEVLQSHIKPHFLYNSFDAISSLALSGNNKDIYNFVKSLGKFYKLFLSRGNEEITIKEELSMVENYLAVHKVRMGGMLCINMVIDERTLDCKIPRLILQPLVENAINHGIKGQKGPGTIMIRSIYSAECISLIVEDDGMGMEQEQIDRIMHGMTPGVGLRVTIERLKIYYNSDHILDIQSSPGAGTKITISLPITKE